MVDIKDKSQCCGCWACYNACPKHCIEMIEDEEGYEAIKYLDNLEVGMFCTVNLPIYSGQIIPVTAMYMGKDEMGRYTFNDTNIFKMSKDFIQEKGISLQKSFNEDKALEIYAKVRKNIERKMSKER